MDKELQEKIEESLVKAGAAAFKMKDLMKGVVEPSEEERNKAIAKYLRPRIYRITNKLTEDQKVKYLQYLTLQADKTLGPLSDEIANLFLEVCTLEDI